MDQRRDDVGAGVALLEHTVDDAVLGTELFPVEGGAEALEEHALARLLDLVERGHALAPQGQARVADHVLQAVDLAPADEGEGPSGAAGAPGAADAVGVVLGVVGQVVVENHFKVVDVEAARGDVGRDKELEAAPLEFFHHLCALALGDVAMQAVHRVAARGEDLGEFIDHDLGGAENDAVAEIVEVDQAGEGLDLGSAVHLEVDLVHLGRVLRQRLDLHPRGVGGVALDELLDRRRHGGREKQRLAAGGGSAGEDALDVVAETHVEHAVGLVENDELDRVELERAALHVVHHAAGRADHDLGAGVERAELPLVGLAAVDGHLAHAFFEEGELGDLLRDLDGEFTRGAEDERLHLLDGGVDAFDHGNAEGGGLARAGGGLADHVAPFQQQRDDGGLDGRGFLESHLVDGLEDFRRETEFGEGAFFHNPERADAPRQSREQKSRPSQRGVKRPAP